MSTAAPPAPTGAAAGLAGAFREWWTDVREGQLGSLPIIFGLLIIAIVFQSQNDRFLTAGNFVNLIVQSAAYTTIAMGIVFVLLLGEIDLSVGYVSGVAGVIAAVLLIPDGNEVGTPIAVGLALLSGIAIGTFHGLIITKIGIPSFVVTLAGLIAWNGVVLLLIGDRGTVVLQDDFLIGLANDFLPESTSWILWLVAVLIFAGIQLNELRVRRKASLDHDPISLIALRIGFLAAGARAWSSGSRTRIAASPTCSCWSASSCCSGASSSAAPASAATSMRSAAAPRPRAGPGINVDRIKIMCFAICSFMAAVGGLILASRLRSVDTNAGGGEILLYSIAAAVIGGTSLFGGIGHIKSALLGALVISSIDNGLGLLGLGSGEKFVITGGVLLLAVTVDSLSRRRQAQTGRA